MVAILGRSVERRAQPCRNLLDMVPQRNREWLATQTGEVKVLAPRYGTSGLGRWVATRLRNTSIPIKLGEIGSAVWQACDGDTTVGQIAKQLEERFGAQVAPVHERLAKFFSELERNRFIRWGCD